MLRSVGMKQAFLTKFYRSYWQELCGLLRAKFGNGPPDPEDIAQQAFMRYAETQLTQPPDNPKAFVYTIARNLIIDAHRQQTRQEQLIDDIFAETGLAPLNESCVESSFLQGEKMLVIERAVASLPAKQRDLIVASRLRGETYQQIAARTGYSMADISRNIERAHTTIQTILQAWEEGRQQYELQQREYL